jgi:signal transduction histidine kinase
MRILFFSLSIFILLRPSLSQDFNRASIDSLVEEGKVIYYASPSKALATGRKIVELSEAISYEQGAFEGLRLIGNSHYLMGRLDSAAYCMLMLLEKAYQTENLGMQADVMIDIGQTYDKIGLHSLAFDYFKQAHEIRLKAGEPERLSVTFINLGYHYYLRDMLDSALVYYDYTEAILDTIPLTYTKPFLYNERGGVYLKQGLYDKAREEINKAIALNNQLGNNWDLAYNYVLLADLEHAVSNNMLAMVYAKKALKISQENNISIEFDLIYKIMSEINDSQGNHALALDYLNKSYAYRDSLNLALTDQKILAVDHYKRQKDNEIENLRLVNENLAQESQISSQRVILASTLSVLILVISAALILYRQNKKLHLAQGKIESQNSDLKKLNVTKNKLFSIITHDIRNPIHNINGMLQLARDGMITGEDFKKFAGSLVDQTSKISSLSTTLINWSKSQESGMSAEAQPLKVDDLITNSMQYLGDLSNQKHIALEHSTNPQLTALADPSMMLLVLNNLFTNAIKFTPENGRIEVSSRWEDDMAVISIVDNGIGIPQDLMQSLNKGHVLTQSGTDGEEGTGIGLLLTLELIALQGGKLSAEQNEKQGSTFSIFLPSSK